jgi:hypothetical protein
VIALSASPREPMETIEKPLYRFSTRTGVLAATSNGQPVGRVLCVADHRWRFRCHCCPTSSEGYRTRYAAHDALVAHLAEVSA